MTKKAGATCLVLDLRDTQSIFSGALKWHFWDPSRLSFVWTQPTYKYEALLQVVA